MFFQEQKQNIQGIFKMFIQNTSFKRKKKKTSWIKNFFFFTGTVEISLLSFLVIEKAQVTALTFLYYVMFYTKQAKGAQTTKGHTRAGLWKPV